MASKSAPVCSILELPLELVDAILDHLTHGDRLLLSQTCKPMRNLLNTGHDRAMVRRGPSDKRLAFLDALVHHNPDLWTCSLCSITHRVRKGGVPRVSSTGQAIYASSGCTRDTITAGQRHPDGVRCAFHPFPYCTGVLVAPPLSYIDTISGLQESHPQIALKYARLALAQVQARAEAQAVADDEKQLPMQHKKARKLLEHLRVPWRSLSCHLPCHRSRPDDALTAGHARYMRNLLAPLSWTTNLEVWQRLRIRTFPVSCTVQPRIALTTHVAFACGAPPPSASTSDGKCLHYVRRISVLQHPPHAGVAITDPNNVACFLICPHQALNWDSPEWETARSMIPRAALAHHEGHSISDCTLDQVGCGDRFNLNKPAHKAQLAVGNATRTARVPLLQLGWAVHEALALARERPPGALVEDVHISCPLCQTDYAVRSTAHGLTVRAWQDFGPERPCGDVNRVITWRRMVSGVSEPWTLTEYFRRWESEQPGHQWPKGCARELYQTQSIDAEAVMEKATVPPPALPEVTHRRSLRWWRRVKVKHHL